MDSCGLFGLKIQIVLVFWSSDCSVEIDFNLLLVFSLLGSWFITWGKGAFCWGIIIKVIIGVRESFSGKGSLPGGGSLINLMQVVQSSDN